MYVSGQNEGDSRDDTLNTLWPAECRTVEIRSSADGSLQKARFYASARKNNAPLIVSLHTWSGDYNQEDPLVEGIIQRGWNYIHPDFRGSNTRPEAGGSDLVTEDIEDAINYALRNSDANPADVHIVGVSGGGYATLAAYMKIDYPVKSFNAWAAISDLDAWYDECKSRKLKYAGDLENITTGGTHFEAVEARRRSPMHMSLPGKRRSGADLNIYAGISDGYTGSVPITHSINFFNKIARSKFPGENSLVVPDSIIIQLLGRRVDPQKHYEKRLGDRNVYLSTALPGLSLTIFEGGHEMLVPQALSLIPVRGIDNGSYLSGKLPSERARATQSPVSLSGPSVESHTADTNVVLPPAWAFGILYGGYTDQKGTIERIKAIQAHDYPIDGYWIDSWFWSFADSGAGPSGYLDFKGDSAGYPDRRAMWSWMESNNIKGGFWVWDCIQKTGNEEAFSDFLEKGFFSSVYLNRNPWHNKGSTTAMFSEEKDHPGTLCGNIDFDNPKAVRYFKERLKPFLEEGADFIKLDRTDRIIVCKSVYELTVSEGKESKGRGLILSHSGGTDSEDYKRYPLKWTDDTRSDWTVKFPLVSFDTWVPEVALKENIMMYTNPGAGTSKIPFLTNDLGGFDIGKTEKPEEELYIRWMQFSMFCPVTEVFSQPENPTSNLAWNYSAYADSLFREYSHLRMQLFPYLYSYAHITRLHGINMIRPIPGHLHEYMLGNEILVAPVFEKGSRERTVHVPEGQWINFWSGELIAGGREYVMEAPLGQIPLLVPAGAIIPERPYYSSIEQGSNDTLTLNIFPGADYSFTLIEDDGLSNDYHKGMIAKTEITGKVTADGLLITINPVQGSFDGMTAYRQWNLKVHTGNIPANIKVNGQKRPFEYDHDKGEAFIRAGDFNKNIKTEVRVFFRR